MPLTSGLSGGLAGVKLKGWAVVSSAGVVLKSSPGITASKTGTGSYDVNVPGVAVARVEAEAPHVRLLVGAEKVTMYFYHVDSSAIDGKFHIEVYE